jgi:hypothetical protein
LIGVYAVDQDGSAPPNPARRLSNQKGMARISGVEPEQASLLARFVYWMVRRKIGRVVLPIKITAHHPRLLRALAEMETGQAAAKTVDTGLKSLASVKTAMLIGCPF